MRSFSVSSRVSSVVAVLACSSAVGCAATTDDAVTTGGVGAACAHGERNHRRHRVRHRYDGQSLRHAEVPRVRLPGGRRRHGRYLGALRADNDAMAWLLRSDFGTVATNDDADYDADEDTSTTSDAHIVKRITTAQPLLALRSARRRRPPQTSPFVLIAPTDPPPPPPPPAGENPWACSGAPLSGQHSRSGLLPAPSPSPFCLLDDALRAARPDVQQPGRDARLGARRHR